MIDDAGASTVEAALAIAALLAVAVLCVGGVGAVNASVRCTDAAREAARLVARGDQSSAMDVARAIAPAGADIRVRREGAFIVATVGSDLSVLPGVRIHAEAVAAAEYSVAG